MDGLVAEFDYSQTGEGRVHERGRDGALYFHGSTTYVQSFTYAGRTVTT